jgi:hypothetical protein
MLARERNNGERHDSTKNFFPLDQACPRAKLFLSIRWVLKSQLISRGGLEMKEKKVGKLPL